MAWQVEIPRAVQLVIDDVGWREGWRLDADGGPFRAGVDRLLEPADYQAIVDLGRAVGIRPSAATILCEWDPADLCAAVPTSTQAGRAWSNRERIGHWVGEAAAIYAEYAAHLELCLHGVGHEHWEEGVRTRAEWHGADGQKWSWDALRSHLDLYRRILDHHGLGPAAGHRFPIHFVPCAFCYEWDNADPTDTGALMATAGVELVSTPFAGRCHRRSPLLAADGGLNHGRLVLDRGSNGVPWHAVDQVPAEPADLADSLAPLTAAAEAAPAMDRDERDVLLARRRLGRAEDTQRLVEAHVPVLTAVARLYAGRGLRAEELLSVGRVALAAAVESYAAESGAEFDLHAEQKIRAALEAAVAAAPAGERAPSPGSFCGIHWPNLLRLDPAENEIAVAHWADYLQRVAALPGHLLAANVREAFAQWAWHTFAAITPLHDGFTLDTRAVPAELYAVVGEWPVIVEVGGFQRLGRARSDGPRPVWFRRQGGRAFVAVAMPESGVGEVRFAADQGPLEPIVHREGTFDVLDLRETHAGLELELVMYGTQTVPIAAGFAPQQAEVVSGQLRLLAHQHAPALGLTRLRIAGHDIQGERGVVRLVRAA